LIFGDPSDHKWRLMCNEALHINTSEQPEFAYLPDGRLMIGTSRGLLVTADEGCTWRGVEPFGMTSTPALAQDPSSPSTLYAATYGPGMSAVRRSKDSGATWTVLLPADDNDFIQELLIAPGDHKRLYASGEALDTGKFTHYVTRSDDGGMTWTPRRTYDVLDTEADLTLLAVSPSDRDLILAVAVANSPMQTPDRVLVSSDGGETFAERGTFSGVLGGGFSTDGTTAWVAGPMGLLRSTDGAKTFAPVTGPTSMSCIFAQGTTTFGCGWYEAMQNGIGTSNDDGTTFAPWMAFTEVTESVQCSDDSETTSLCATLWRDWQREIFRIYDAGTPASMVDAAVQAQPDAGAAPRDAGTIVSPTGSEPGTAGNDEGAKHDPESSGCATRPARGGAGLPLTLLACCFVLWQRRRRRA
jgi:hypothetical protein